MGKRFDVSTPRPKGGRSAGSGETWWHRVGSAWQNDDGQITVYLDSYPIADREGVVKMMLFEPKQQGAAVPEKKHLSAAERAAAERQSGRSLSEELDDEIPF